MTGEKLFKRFLTVWAGELLSSIGTGLTAFTLTAHAFIKTGLASGPSMILLASFLPSFLLRPLGGILADRMDRRLLMITGSLGSALGVLMIFFMISPENSSLGMIFPGLIVSSVFSALQNPSYKASVTDLLPPDLYGKAGAMIQLAGAAPLLLSPFIAGILMSLIGIRFILIIDILTFIVSALAVLSVRRGMEVIHSDERMEKSGILEDLSEGISALMENRGILILTFLVSLILFYVGLLQALLAPMVLSFADTAVLGTVQSVCAVGVLAGSIILSSIGIKGSYVKVISASLAVMGLSFSFIGMRENFPMIIIPGFIFFFTLPFVNTGIEVLIRGNIRNRLQGRVWSMISFITYSGSIIAFASAGFLSDVIFNPLLIQGGMLSDNLGLLFGTGEGRGIAFLFCLSGLSIFLVSFFLSKTESIRKLEQPSC